MKRLFLSDGRSAKRPNFLHKIELLPDAKPFNERLRRRPQVLVEPTKKQIKRMLAEGIIGE